MKLHQETAKVQVRPPHEDNDIQAINHNLFGTERNDELQKPISSLSFTSNAQDETKQEESNKDTTQEYECLKNPTFMHEKKRLFLCSMCLKKYDFECNLKRHMKLECQKPLAFICTVCKKGFHQKCNLKRHMDIHNKDAKGQCLRLSSGVYVTDPISHNLVGTERNDELQKPISSLSFTSNAQEETKQEESNKDTTQEYECLKDPTFMHKKKRLFLCSMCLKKYDSECNLKRHMKLECKKPPAFICTVCKKGFHQKCNLKMHMNNHKKGAKGQRLRLSHEVYVTETISHHLFGTERNDELQKPISSLSFTSNAQEETKQEESNKDTTQEYECLKDPTFMHEKKRLFLCSMCLKKYDSECNLKRHMKLECQKPPSFICTVCKKGFHQKCNLKRHMDIHKKGAKGQRLRLSHEVYVTET